MKTRLILLALLGLIALPLGCKKSEAAASPGDYRGDYGGAYGDAYVTDGVATGSSASAPTNYLPAEREFAAGMDTEKSYDLEQSKALDPAPEQANQSSQLEPPDDDSKQPEQAGRQMIYTAILQLAVYELDEVIEFAEDIPERFGGWVQARHDYQITLRVPAGRLAEVMAELSALGMVLNKTLQAADVTAEYTDLESRVAVLEQLEEQLVILLGQAKTVEDSLKVRQELERVRIELEAARTRLRQLAELVGFSTLTLQLIQRGDEVQPGSNDPFPWVDQLGVESTEYR
ncbi:DUF4349 domain-containing protein [Nannocystaceae bacterium ST9]